MRSATLPSGLLFVILVIVAEGCGSGDANDQAAAALIVASDFSNPPFASWEQTDAPVGFEPDLARVLAEELQRPVRWKKMPFRELLTELEEGGADVVIATTGITPERAERVLFSRPYYRTEISVVMRVGVEEPQTLSALSGLSVGASRGTTSERALLASLPAAIPLLDRKEDQSLRQMLLDRSIDAACMDGPDALRLVEQNAGTLRRLDALASERYAIAVGLENAALLARINTILGRLLNDGTLAESARRHGLPDSL